MGRQLRMLVVVLACAPGGARAADSIQGEWRTSLGVVTLSQEGESVTASFKAAGVPPLKGSLKDKTANLAFREESAGGQATFTLDNSGRAFTGWLQRGNGPRRPWNGWKLRVRCWGFLTIGIATWKSGN